VLSFSGERSQKSHLNGQLVILSFTDHYVSTCLAVDLRLPVSKSYLTGFHIIFKFRVSRGRRGCIWNRGIPVKILVEGIRHNLVKLQLVYRLLRIEIPLFIRSEVALIQWSRLLWIMTLGREVSIILTIITTLKLLRSSRSALLLFCGQNRLN
jgi:hypothetical protein